MLKFAYGATRWVILTDRYAIKIARIRPLRPFIRLFEHFSRGQVGEKLQAFDANPFIAGMKYLLAGVVANRLERIYYKKYGGELLMPTVFTFLWIVNVQPRGEPASEAQARTHHFFKLLDGTPNREDFLEVHQYCTIEGRVLLVDYGRKEIEALLFNYPVHA
jgi:hypothetical protein